MGEIIVVGSQFKERGGSHFVTLFGQHEINGVTEFVDGYDGPIIRNSSG